MCDRSYSVIPRETPRGGVKKSGTSSLGPLGELKTSVDRKKGPKNGGFTGRKNVYSRKRHQQKSSKPQKSRHIDGLGVEKTTFLLHGTELRKAGALASLD